MERIIQVYHALYYDIKKRPNRLILRQCNNKLKAPPQYIKAKTVYPS